jgi:hypothetical protein
MLVHFEQGRLRRVSNLMDLRRADLLAPRVVTARRAFDGLVIYHGDVSLVFVVQLSVPTRVVRLRTPLLP